MTQRFKPLRSLYVLLAFAAVLTLGGAASLEFTAAAEGRATPSDETGASANVGQMSEVKNEEIASEASNTVMPKPRQHNVAQIRSNPWHNYPNVCETFTVIEGPKQVKTKSGEKKFPLRYRRLRFQRKRSDQRRTRDLMKMVAAEMGADELGQEIVAMIAMHESSWNPEAIHILNPDLDANQKAWERHTYDAAEEQRLETALGNADARGRKFWGIKARLADIRLYKGNIHWHDELVYTYQIPERTIGDEVIPENVWNEQRSVWAFGYGPFGMNAVLFTYLWDSEAPPWILCADEGIIAAVTAVWALRNGQSECAELSAKDPAKYGSDGGSARGVVRRFARGQCSDRRLGKAWRKLMNNRDGMDWDAVPDLGEKFTRFEMYKRRGKWRFRRGEDGRKIRTDRVALLEHMRAKAAKKGLLRPKPLERKHPDSEPVVVGPEDNVAAAPVPQGDRLASR